MFFIEKFIEYFNELYPINEDFKTMVLESVSGVSKPVKMIEIEAGPNLFSTSLFTNGFDITATDTFSEFSRIANSNKLNKENNVHVFNIATIDIARYLGCDYFNIALCINSRILIINNITLLKKFLFDVKMLLKENGIFIIEVANFSKYDLLSDKIVLPERKSSRICMESSVTRENEIYYLWETLINSKNNNTKVVTNRQIYPVTKETIEKIAKEVKYSSVEFYNDYKKTPYSIETDRIVCVLRK